MFNCRRVSWLRSPEHPNLNPTQIRSAARAQERSQSLPATQWSQALLQTQRVSAHQNSPTECLPKKVRGLEQPQPPQISAQFQRIPALQSTGICSGSKVLPCHESKFWNPGTLAVIQRSGCSSLPIWQYLSHFSPLFIPCPVCRGSVKNRPTATARFGPAGVASLEVGRNSWLRARQDVLHTCSANVNQKFQMFSKSTIKNPKKESARHVSLHPSFAKRNYFTSNDHHLTLYSDIVSDIPSGSMYGIYILTVYLTLFPGITYSDFLSDILSDIVSPWVRVTPHSTASGAATEAQPRSWSLWPHRMPEIHPGHDAHHQQSWRHLSVISGEIG